MYYTHQGRRSGRGQIRGTETDMQTITKVNVCRNLGEWCYAAWTEEGYDHSDTLDAESESEAIAAASTQFPGAEVTRVADTNIA